MRPVTLALAFALALFSRSATAQEPAPEASPSATPAATPEAEATATPTPVPAATAIPTPEPSATATPAPIDYRGGMPGRPPGPRDWRVGVLLGAHAFAGQGWNDDDAALPIPEDDRRRTEDFVAAAIAGEAIFDLQPTFAAVAIAGAHSGQREADDVTAYSTSFTAWHASGALRFQTPAGPFGLYLQAGAGVYLGLKKVDHRSNDDLDDEYARAGTIVHAAGGVTFHASPGLDFVAEVRGSRAPGRFEDERVDLGGLTATVGATIRVP